MKSIEEFFRDADISWWNPADGLDKKFWFFNKQLVWSARRWRLQRNLCIRYVLDAGCGKGVHSKPLKALEYRTVISLNINRDVLNITRSYTETSCVQASLLRLPFSDSSLDVILSVGAIHACSVC